jgi:putative membrane protein insertion efficiency factor
MNTREESFVRTGAPHATRGHALLVARRIARALIRGYQLALSPWLGGNCRFYPSCSHYALEAVDQHGVVRGGWLTLKRVCKCHPFHPGGVDFVPAPESKRGYSNGDG